MPRVAGETARGNGFMGSRRESGGGALNVKHG